ncbi:murein L,D-transpeptidase family protein [Cardiobacterium hominis]|uniref:murein L,D-transpeptidase family protein n=1 Tax=Cardiobacterium hominis TaxID=2718 RepID=UPI0028E5E8BD|nr:murein L,D-transpeptidase family protein [Cardiobacterium hominis]
MKKQTFLLAALALILAACSSRTPETQRDSRLIRRPPNPTLQDRLEARGFRFGAPAFIRIFKKEEVLEVWLQKDSGEYALFLDYPICIYSGELGPKTREGDKQSPEGFYAVGREAMNPNSQYHLSFNLGYPNAYDRAHGYSGSMLMVHGKCVSIGCYAMGDRQIEEIYTLVGSALQRGQPYVRVHAFPFRMTDANLAAYSEHRWYDFWRMLKPGYDYFERYHQPPEIDVIGGQYALSGRNPHPAVRPGEQPPGRSTPTIPSENLNSNPFTGTAIASAAQPSAAPRPLLSPNPAAPAATLNNAFQAAASNSALSPATPLNHSSTANSTMFTSGTSPDNAWQTAAAPSATTTAYNAQPGLMTNVSSARLGLPAAPANVATNPLTLTSSDEPTTTTYPQHNLPPAANAPYPGVAPSPAPLPPANSSAEPMPVLRGALPSPAQPLDLTSYGTPSAPVN